MDLIRIIKTSGIIMLFLTIVYSCELETNIEGNGKVVSKRRNVQPFNEISINGVFDVYLYQREFESLSIETDENLQKLIDVEVINGTLYIKNDDKIDYKATKMDVFVTVTNIEKINLDGVTALYCKDMLKLSELEIEKNNTGLMLLKTELDKLVIRSYDVGEIKLRGSANKVDFNNSMIGDIRAYEFITKDMNLVHDGIGEIQVNVTNKLSVELSGVGNVRCVGNPEIVDKMVSGTGKVYIQP